MEMNNHVEYDRPTIPTDTIRSCENINTQDSNNENVDECQEPFSTLISMFLRNNGIGSFDKRKELWQKINEIKPNDYLRYWTIDKSLIETHKCAKIVRMDSERYNHCLINNSISNKDPITFGNTLYEMIMRVLCHHKKLVYYQGYHDIAATVLLVMGEEKGTVLLSILSYKHLKDFMCPDFKKTIKYLDFVAKLIEINDYELYIFLKKSNVGNVFCLPWLLTWYSHNVGSLSLACRLFDLFMVSDKYMPAYIASTLVIGLRDEILILNNDLATVHCFLANIPEFVTNDNWESAIENALYFYDKYPPNVVFTFNARSFPYRVSRILSLNWISKRTNKTLLKNSIINGKARFLRKDLKKHQSYRSYSTSSFHPIYNFYNLSVKNGIAGLSLLLTAMGLYSIYTYFKNLII